MNLKLDFIRNASHLLYILSRVIYAVGFINMARSFILANFGNNKFVKRYNFGREIKEVKEPEKLRTLSI